MLDGDAPSAPLADIGEKPIGNELTPSDRARFLRARQDVLWVGDGGSGEARSSDAACNIHLSRAGVRRDLRLADNLNRKAAEVLRGTALAGRRADSV